MIEWTKVAEDIAGKATQAAEAGLVAGQAAYYQAAALFAIAGELQELKLIAFMATKKQEPSNEPG